MKPAGFLYSSGMIEGALVAQRAEQIASVLAVANELLAVARQPTVRAQIQFAVRDLEEAHGWLDHQRLESDATLQQIVDLFIQHAEGRLGVVELLLQTRGPDAALAEPTASEHSYNSVTRR